MSYYVIEKVNSSGLPVCKPSNTITSEYIQIEFNGDYIFTNNNDIVSKYTIYSKRFGLYIWKANLSNEQLRSHCLFKGTNLYNYSFDREYEAVNHFDLFNGKENVLYNEKYIGANELKYTFGIEYETACGMIPEQICYRDGLIPLRDGSISGPEYSTIILKGSKGVNLVRQQCETLKEYTDTNKECALHIHFGGYPVRGTFIFTLYSLLYCLQSDIRRHTNEFVFNTRKYKSNGKDYCMSLYQCSSFSELYESMVGMKFQNSLRKPHPSDIDHNHKWQIRSRYYWVNFINMLCYEGPKTVEFRFLRPTFNFSKIYTWILVLNGLMMRAESLTKKYGPMSAYDISNKFDNSIINHLTSVYSDRTVDAIENALNCIRNAEDQKRAIGDYAGIRTDIDDKFINIDYKM